MDVRLTKMEAQIERLVSDAESEKETRRRRNSELDKRIVKLHDLIHGNGKEGLILKVDRLERQLEEEKNRARNKFYNVTSIVGLLISLAALLIMILK